MMMTTERCRLDEQAWVNFGKRLLHEKGGPAQNDFLEVCLSGQEGFMEYIHEHILSHSDRVLDDGLVDFLGDDFTERQFLHPPKTTQEDIWETFRGESKEKLYSCGRWGYVTIRMVETGRIQPKYLASNLNGTNKDGLFVIDNAMKNSDVEKDKCVRRILRSMCNSEPRGKRIVFNDFPIGKSYWRWHWADRMHQHIGIDFNQALDVLDEQNYAKFSERMHTFKKSYIGSENTLGGMILFLAQQQNAARKITGLQLGKIIDNIGYLSAWKAIEMQDPQANKKEIEQIARAL